VIRFAPKKSNERAVVEEQAVWRDHKLLTINM